MRLFHTRFAIAAVVVFCLSSTGWAQGVLSRSIDVAGTLAFNGESGIDGSRHPAYGLSGAYNRWGNLAVIGEFEYQPFGATTALRQVIQTVGGGVRYYFKQSPKVVPYITATGGFARLATAQIGSLVSTTDKDAYFAAGGGASFYVGDSWGVRPEVRFQDELYGARYPFKEVQGSVSLFYQFGGSGAAKKK